MEEDTWKALAALRSSQRNLAALWVLSFACLAFLLGTSTVGLCRNFESRTLDNVKQWRNGRIEIRA